MKTLIPFLFLSLTSFTTAAAELTQNCHEQYRTGRLNLYQCDNLKVIRVKGAPTERMAELGKLHARSLASNKTLDYFATAVEKQAGDSSLLQSIIRSIYDAWVNDRNKQIPQSYKDEFKAFTKNAGYSQAKYHRALLLPDMGSYSTLLESHGHNNLNYSFGCSSFAKIEDTEMSFGRNLDFPGIHTYDQNPVITIHLPENNSNEIAHAAFASDGLYYSSISGINKEGIFLVVHQNFSKDHSNKGLPLYLVGETVLRSAHNLTEAIELLQKNRPLGMWTFVVGSLQEKKLATVESSFRRFNFKINEDADYAQANHLRFTPDRNQIELLGAGDRYNSTFRIAKGLEILRSPAGQLENVLQSLQFQENSDGSLNSTHDILKAETIHTVMFNSAAELSSSKIFMAIDQAPVSSGRFLEFNWNNLWNEVPTPQVSFEPKDVRKRQKQMNISNSLFEIAENHNPQKGLALIADHDTYSAQALKSTLWLELDEPKHANEQLDIAIAKDWKMIPAHMQESFWAMKALIAYKSFKPKVAKKYIDTYFSLKPKNEDLRDFMISLNKYNNFSLTMGIPGSYLMKDFSASYDFFSGDILFSEGI